MASSRTQTQLYSHAAEPKAVQQKRAKASARDEEPQQLQPELLYPSNIMFDRRVVRGNTYAARVLPAEPAILSGGGGKAGTIPAGRSRAGGGVQSRVVATPDPVPGRRHMDIQTEVYLEELADTAPEADCVTQTDEFLDRPPTPAFVPQKSGVDSATQIEQGDLFDFDLEVEPILEVLVGKVLEQGLMEVLQEEELAAMRRHQAHFESVRAAELVAAQRLEAAERRKLEERERRLRQERERKERERVVRAKVAASAFARGYLNGIVSSVFQTLQDTGFFVDPVEKEVEDAFMPWLQQAAAQHAARNAVAHAVVQQLVADAVVLREQQRKAAMAAVDAEAAAAEAAAKREAEAAAARAAAELAAIRGRAALILRGLDPPVVDEEAVEQARAELQTQAAGDAEAAWEAERARVGEARRAQLEADSAAAAAAAQQAAGEGEEDGAEGGAADGGGADVEAEVAAAMEGVAKPQPREVTDGDVLSALMEKGAVTKEALIRALAVASLGEQGAAGAGDDAAGDALAA